jgi:hypothetical protein
MGPCLVVSHGNSVHSKQSLTPFWWAQLQIWQNLFSFATQPTAPLGQVPLVILGHFSHAIPQTPTFKFIPSLPLKKTTDPYLNGKLIFSLVVVAGNRLYTTTTSRLRGRLLFNGSVWFGLQAGCATRNKQSSIKGNA